VLLFLLLGACVGLILGVTGTGGGILAVPLLVFGAGLSTAQAGPIGLVAVGMSAALAALQALRAGQLRYRAAAVMAACGALFAPLGILLAQRLEERVLTLLFAAVLLHVDQRALCPPTPGLAQTAPPCCDFPK